MSLMNSRKLVSIHVGKISGTNEIRDLQRCVPAPRTRHVSVVPRHSAVPCIPPPESSCYIQLQTVSSSKHQASLVTPFWPQERTSQHLLFETQPFDLVERGFFPPRTRSSFSISARFLHSQRSVHVLTWLWQKNLHHHHHRPTKNIVRQCTPLNFQPSRLFTTSRL